MPISLFSVYSKIIIHSIIGLLALILGYPYGGSLFIIVMLPYLVYMVLKCDARFMPALILHCASGTSASYIVFLIFIILSIVKYKVLINIGLKPLFWILMLLLPIFVWLTLVHIYTYNFYPPIAISYIGYYISYFAFFYGILIHKTFSKYVVYAIYTILFIVFVLYNIGALDFIRIVVGFTFLFSSAIALLLARKSQNIILFALSSIALFSVINVSEETTLTTIFISFASLSIAYLYFNKKIDIIQKSTGILPFILIIGLLVYGINNYFTITTNNLFYKSITNFSSLRTWVTFKFFEDRAPFWAGGIQQINESMHFFPIPNMPDFYATLPKRKEIEIRFGAHSTFIELIRKYGIISGALLNFSLIYIVIKSRKVFLVMDLYPLLVPLFSIAIVTTIVLTFTGTYQLLPEYALLSLGLLGIAYSIYINKINYR